MMREIYIEREKKSERVRFLHLHLESPPCAPCLLRYEPEQIRVQSRRNSTYIHIRIHTYTDTHAYARTYVHTCMHIYAEAGTRPIRTHAHKRVAEGRERKRIVCVRENGHGVPRTQEEGGGERHRGNNKERGDERGMQGLQGCGFVDETECVCVRVRRHACAVHTMQKKKGQRRRGGQCRRSMLMTQETPRRHPTHGHGGNSVKGFGFRMQLFYGVGLGFVV